MSEGEVPACIPCQGCKEPVDPFFPTHVQPGQDPDLAMAAYRCYMCNAVFCEVCAAKHFDLPEPACEQRLMWKVQALEVENQRLRGVLADKTCNCGPAHEPDPEEHAHDCSYASAVAKDGDEA